MPKVSVIVPVYNVENYLAKCLDSLVNQTLKDIEIIVVNDGSPDNSQDIIDKYAKKYKNIKAYKKENGGLSDARNYGIKKATGDYIAFVDSDDYVDTTMYEKMYKKATKNNYDIVVCDFAYLYEDGRIIPVKSNLHYAKNNVKNYLLLPPMATIRIIKRELLNKYKFKKNIFYEDLELMPKLADTTDKIGFLEEPLYYYLQRNGSIMRQSMFSNKLLDIFSVLESNKEVLYNKYPEEIEYMYIIHLLRTATLRFLNYKNPNIYLKQIRDTMKEYFPNWKNNIYYKKSNKKIKLICILAYSNCKLVLKIIKKITSK